MRLWSNPTATLASAILACFLGGGVAGAQTINVSVSNIALKNGESTEFADLWWITHDCRSLLTATPAVEVMDGPPGVTVTIKQAMVVPRTYGCVKPISGGKMIISAKDVEDYSRSSMVLRVTFKTRNGDRQRSQNLNVTLFP
jgi:hypothetical protein